MSAAVRVSGCLAIAALVGAGAVLGAAAPEERAESWLGIVLGDVEDGGLQVLAVVPGGPADDAGLERGDVLLALGEAGVGDGVGVRDVARVLPPGRPVAVRFGRSGRILETSIVPVRRVDSPYVMVPLGEEPSPAVLGEMLVAPDSTAGIRASRMSAELREFFGAPPDAGVLLTRVAEGTAGARAGFRVGDVLVRLGDTPIRTPSDLLTKILVADETGELEASVVRRKESIRIVLDLSAERLAATPGSGLPERYLESAFGRENRVKMLEKEIRALNRRIRDLEEQLRKTGTDR